MKTTLYIILFLSFSTAGFTQLDSTTTPIRLSYFEAGSNSSATTLQWKTVCYLDYATFDIQRSTDGTTYQTINNFTADRLRCQQPFDYTDINSNASGRIFYRINVSDIDGKAYTSRIISVFTQGKGFTINSFAPTIVQSGASVSISSATNERVVMTVINMQGGIAARQNIAATKGAGTYTISLDNLQRGFYQAVFQTEQGEKNTISFIKQ